MQVVREQSPRQGAWTTYTHGKRKKNVGLNNRFVMVLSKKSDSAKGNRSSEEIKRAKSEKSEKSTEKNDKRREG